MPEVRETSLSTWLLCTNPSDSSHPFYISRANIPNINGISFTSYKISDDPYYCLSNNININVIKYLQRFNDVEKIVNKKIVDLVRGFTLYLCVQPEIYPLGQNGIQLEYDGIDNSYLEFEIYNEEEINMYKIDRDGNEEYKTIKCQYKEINKAVCEFYEI